MTSWLDDFMAHCAERPGNSCSCSKDCDHERDAAYQEILRLRAESVPRRLWGWWKRGG